MEDREIKAMRDALYRYTLDHPQSYNYYAMGVGISHRAFVDFIKDRRDSYPSTLGKIRKYLLENNIIKEYSC